MSKLSELPTPTDVAIMEAFEQQNLERIKIGLKFADAMHERVHPKAVLAILKLVPPQPTPKRGKGRPKSISIDVKALTDGYLITKASELAPHGHKAEAFVLAAKERGLTEGTAERRKKLYRKQVAKYAKELTNEDHELFFERIRQAIGDPIPTPLWDEDENPPASYVKEFNEELTAWERRNVEGRQVLKRLPVPKKQRR